MRSRLTRRSRREGRSSLNANADARRPPPDALPVRPASFAGTSGGACGVPRVRRRTRARRLCRLHPGRPLRLVGRRRPDGRSVRREDRRVARGDPCRRRAGVRRTRQPRLPARRAIRRGRGRDAASGLPRGRRGRRAHAAVPWRRAVHRRHRVPGVPRAHAQPRDAGAPAATPLLRPPRARVVAAAQEPQRQGTQGRVDHGRRDRRGRGRVPRARRDADDPRPHAPAGAARTCGRRHGARALRARRLARPRPVPRVRRERRPRPRESGVRPAA